MFRRSFAIVDDGRGPMRRWGGKFEPIAIRTYFTVLQELAIIRDLCSKSIAQAALP